MTLKKKINNLNSGNNEETYVDEQTKNLENLSTQSRKWNLGLKACATYKSEIEEYIVNVDVAIRNLKEEEKSVIRAHTGIN